MPGNEKREGEGKNEEPSAGKFCRGREDSVCDDFVSQGSAVASVRDVHRSDGVEQPRVPVRGEDGARQFELDPRLCADTQGVPVYRTRSDQLPRPGAGKTARERFFL